MYVCLLARDAGDEPVLLHTCTDTQDSRCAAAEPALSHRPDAPQRQSYLPQLATC